MDKMIRERISSLFLFHEMHFEELDAKYHVMEKVIIQKYCTGEILLSARENPVGLAILLDGSAQILSGDEKHPALLRTMGAGDSFGAASLFSGEKGYRTCVRALEDCRILYLPAVLVEEICLHEPMAARNYIVFLSGRISFLNRKITAYTAGSALERLVLYLLHLPLASDGSWELDISYAQLSEQLGVGRASLYRAMDSLCAQGLIRREKKKVTPLQLETLKLMIQ